MGSDRHVGEKKDVLSRIRYPIFRRVSGLVWVSDSLPEPKPEIPEKIGLPNPGPKKPYVVTK